MNKICNKIARELNLDNELVKQIVSYQFKFIKDVMTDSEDYHDILLGKLFRFSLKPRYKINKTQKYSAK